MSKHLAGGIRNPKSTSYINCTLQILLNFRPFRELLKNHHDHNKDNVLIKILLDLALKIHSTDNSVSADSLISFFEKDPSIFSDIISFLKQLIETLPSDFNSLINIIELDSNSNFLDISDFSFSDSFKMLVICRKPEYQYENNINEFIISNDVNYALFSIVQISGRIETSSNGHYSILVRDTQGWIQCNDTSVTAIENEKQLESIIHDARSPIELLTYTNDLGFIDFNRRPVKFSNTRLLSITSSPDILQSTQKKSIRLFPPFPSEEKKTFLENVSSSSSSSDLDVSSILDKNTTKSTKLQCKFYDGKIMRVLKEEILEITDLSKYKHYLEELNVRWNREFNDILQYKFNANSRFVDKVPDLTEDNISVIFQRKNMPLFHNTLFRDDSNGISIEFQVLETTVIFKGQFSEYQTVLDIKSYAETFHTSILKAKKAIIYIFVLHQGRVFQVSESIRINEIEKILETTDLKFGITFGNKEPRGLAKISIPLFETKKHFLFLDVINRYIKIDDKFQFLLDLAKTKLKEAPLQIYYFDQTQTQFFRIDESEYIFNFMDMNIRIQKRIETDGIPFIIKNNPDKPPFSYPLSNNQSMFDLTKQIKEYIGNSKITLEYNNPTKSIEKIPKNDYIKGKFKFMYVVEK